MNTYPRHIIPRSLGSCVDVHLPQTLAVKVSIGDNVFATTTNLASLARN